MAKGNELPREVRGMFPRKFFEISHDALRCNLVYFETQF